MSRCTAWIGVAVAGVLLAAGTAIAADAAIDWNKARDIYQRAQRGGKLTPEEQAYLDKAKAAKGGGSQPGERGVPPTKGQDSTGLIPLTDMKANQKYEGLAGGLYGGARNEPPEDQAKRAQAAAAKITPLDAEGKPAADGKVVLMSIGMSNTTQVFSRFKALADADSEKSPKLVIVDSAQGGQDAAAWIAGADPLANRTWAEADKRLKAAGVTPRQVQVVWLKQALIQPARRGGFPAHAKELQADIETILSLASAHFPNLRLSYLTSRTYGGYASTLLNPEPYAYESGFSVRWVIEDQMKGDAKMNCDPAHGEVKAPVVLWGPYFWTDGAKGRAAGDLVWSREDVAGDGTHPSRSGQQKAAELLLKFLKADPYVKGWFLAGGGK